MITTAFYDTKPHDRHYFGSALASERIQWQFGRARLARQRFGRTPGDSRWWSEDGLRCCLYREESALCRREAVFQKPDAIDFTEQVVFRQQGLFLHANERRLETGGSHQWRSEAGWRLEICIERKGGRHGRRPGRRRAGQQQHHRLRAGRMDWSFHDMSSSCLGSLPLEEWQEIGRVDGLHALLNLRQITGVQ
jgi:hypothetical protein